MKIIIHRGTLQVGGVATEIRKDNSRIIIDMGDELSVDPDFVPAPFNIPGVSDNTDRSIFGTVPSVCTYCIGQINRVFIPYSHGAAFFRQYK